MACKRSEQCTHGKLCKYANSEAYDILGGSCYKPKKPMTNEEYIRSCSTEQLAEFLADQCNEVVEFILNEVDEHAGNIEPDDYWYRQDVVAEWLKKPHKE